MEQEHDGLFQDNGGQEDRYYQDLDLNTGAEIDIEMNYDVPTDAGFLDCLPQSFLPPGGGIANLGWTSGSFLVASTESEPSMRCFNSISDYPDGFDTTSYVFSNPQNPSGTFFSGKPSELLPDTGGYRSENYSYSFATGSGQNELLENGPVPFGEASDSPDPTSNSSFPSIIPPHSSGSPISTASSSQKRTKAKSKASSSGKNKINDMLTCFPTNQQPKARRTKKPIPPSEREAYKLARNVGSCARCKARKIKARDPIPVVLLITKHVSSLILDLVKRA
jgi:hypothetical protein